jgi:hypothetical protein
LVEVNPLVVWIPSGKRLSMNHRRLARRNPGVAFRNV